MIGPESWACVFEYRPEGYSAMNPLNVLPERLQKKERWPAPR